MKTLENSFISELTTFPQTRIILNRVSKNLGVEISLDLLTIVVTSFTVKKIAFVNYSCWAGLNCFSPPFSDVNLLSEYRVGKSGDCPKACLCPVPVYAPPALIWTGSTCTQQLCTHTVLLCTAANPEKSVRNHAYNCMRACPIPTNVNMQLQAIIILIWKHCTIIQPNPNTPLNSL